MYYSKKKDFFFRGIIKDKNKKKKKNLNKINIKFFILKEIKFIFKLQKIFIKFKNILILRKNNLIKLFLSNKEIQFIKVIFK